MRGAVYWILTCMDDTSVLNVAATNLYSVINRTNDPSIATGFTRRRNVKRVLENLEGVGGRVAGFKTDVFTTLGINSGNEWKISPVCLYKVVEAQGWNFEEEEEEEEGESVRGAKRRVEEASVLCLTLLLTQPILRY